MPKIEAKYIQKELEQGKLWPLYVLHGGEAMKSRELLKRIRAALFGGASAGGTADGAAAEKAAAFAASFGETRIEGAEAEVGEILDAAQGLALGGGARLVVVKDADKVKELEKLAPIAGPPKSREEVGNVVVLLVRDLDQRKKSTKMFVEKAATVPCEEIGEDEREAWIQYLAKRRGIALSPEEVLVLRTMDPWSLDSIERELEKWELAAMPAGDGVAPLSAAERLQVLTGGEAGAKSERFISCFLARERAACVEEIGQISEELDLLLPMLGLLGWNTRMLASLLKDQEARTRDTKLSPYLAQRLSGYLRLWSLPEVVDLQRALTEIDFSLKQTPRVTLGMFDELVLRFCR